MSFHAVAWAIDREMKDPLGKLVLILLAHCHNHEDGRCFPSTGYLAEMAGASRGSVLSKLKSLKDQGLIEIIPRTGRDGGARSNAYVLNMQSGRQIRATPVPDYSDEGDALASGQSSPPPYQNTRGGSTTTAPPPVQPLNPPCTIGNRIPIDARAGNREEEHGQKNKEKTPVVPLAGDNPLAGRRVNGQPNAEAKAMIQAFAIVYAQRFGRAYAPHPKDDPKAAQGLQARGLTAELVAGTFAAAGRSRGWWCGKVTTLPDLARRWNEIGAELAGKNGGHGGMAPDGIGTTEEWVESLRQEPK